MLKTLLNIEGMGREVYPDLDLWVTAKPFLERWMDEQVGVRSLINGMQKNFPKFMEQAPGMPVALNEAILQVAKLGHPHQLSNINESKQLADSAKQSNQQIVISIIGSGLLIAAVLNHGLSGNQALSMFSGLMGGIGMGFLMYALLKRS